MKSAAEQLYVTVQCNASIDFVSNFILSLEAKQNVIIYLLVGRMTMRTFNNGQMETLQSNHLFSLHSKVIQSVDICRVTDQPTNFD